MRTIFPKFVTYFAADSRFFSIFPHFYIWHLRNVSSQFRTFSTIQKHDDITSSCSEGDWMKKILYNDIFHFEEKSERIRIKNEKKDLMDNSFNSAALINVKPYFIECMNDKKEVRIKDSGAPAHFPYESNKKVIVNDDIVEENLRADEIDADEHNLNYVDYDMQLKNIKKGKLDFKNSTHWQADEEVEILLHDARFGTCDPNIPASNVPCGGCGALLHCMDMGIPGFLPKEIFQDINKADLRGITCQRCLFLREYNVALGINVDPNEYPKIISRIRNENALVILMVDLLDFPCSIWPDIRSVIGKNKELFVVGNKIDLIIQDKNFATHRKECLMNALTAINFDSAKIKHISLISAKTGFGVESLITKLQNYWGTKGDVYIVGCTNVGKSTLFNALLQSDFCKVKASDILQRATVSKWPGTTLNLLKFPILKPLGWRKAIRFQRLKYTEKQMKAFRELQNSYLQQFKRDHQVSLMGYIGRSFPKQKTSHVVGLDPNDPDFRQSKWCYDTPGVVHESQILNLFTTEELPKVLPRRMIVPRNFKLISGNALFIGGIARLDLIASNTLVWFTVFASADLPVTVTNIKDADFIYQKLLGTHLFAVPCGKEERLKKWPKLAPKNINVIGMVRNVAAADIVLSSAGWIAITLATSRSCELRAWTPDGRGIFVREPSLIKYSSQYRSKKIRGTPAYYPSVNVVDNIEAIL